MVTLNVAINSQNNSLITLLVANNFTELKGHVFKKFDEGTLFQVTKLHTLHPTPCNPDTTPCDPAQTGAEPQSVTARCACRCCAPTK